MKHDDIINRYKDFKTQGKDDLLIRSLTHESCEKSFASIHHPASHKKISPKHFIPKLSMLQQIPRIRHQNTSKSEVFIQILN